jgi:hypothetical protein
VIASVTVTATNTSSADNIRASLAQLQVGQRAHLRAISGAIQLANDSPAKQVGVSLADGAAPGTIDAKVSVTDNNPLRVIATLDNTGTPASGTWRTGIALQHANLFDRDQVGTLAYTTAPDKPSGVRLELYSLGYRIPLLRHGRQPRLGLRQVEHQLAGQLAHAGRRAGLHRQGRGLRRALEPLPGPRAASSAPSWCWASTASASTRAATWAARPSASRRRRRPSRRACRTRPRR